MIDVAMDPVCRMSIRPGEAVEATMLAGRWFYFCCPECYAAFVDVPHRYVGWGDGRDPPAERKVARRDALDPSLPCLRVADRHVAVACHPHR